jgi:hypothetical protein
MRALSGRFAAATAPRGFSRGRLRCPMCTKPTAGHRSPERPTGRFHGKGCWGHGPGGRSSTIEEKSRAEQSKDDQMTVNCEHPESAKSGTVLSDSPSGKPLETTRILRRDDGERRAGVLRRRDAMREWRGVRRTADRTSRTATAVSRRVEAATDLVLPRLPRHRGSRPRTLNPPDPADPDSRCSAPRLGMANAQWRGIWTVRASWLTISIKICPDSVGSP